MKTVESSLVLERSQPKNIPNPNDNNIKKHRIIKLENQLFSFMK